MVPKTERFEMRLDPDILERVDNWRSCQGDVPSRAEAIRRLVETGLASATSTREFHPTNSEKLMMWMLAELLKLQKGYENRDTALLIQDAIYGGHFWALEWELTGLLHGHVDSKAALRLVVDTLDMWTFIERAYADFSDDEKNRIQSEVGSWAKDPQFMGFDGNHESEYMSIAQFLVEKLRRFESFKGRSFNSHMPRVEAYRQMVAMFEPMRVGLVGRELSVDQVIELLKRD